VDCVIIGGGPSGLATSIAISKTSPATTIAIHEKDVFERKGASIAISPAGWNSIQQLDTNLFEKLQNICVPVTSVNLKPWAGNRTNKKQENKIDAARQFLVKAPFKLMSAVIQLFGKGVVNRVHLWHDIRNVLAVRAKETYSMAGKDGDTSLVSLNSSLIEVRPLHELAAGEKFDEERFELTIDQNGNLITVRSKFLIACDGTMSKVRSLLPNEPDVLIDEKKSVWRGISPRPAKGRATFYADKHTGRSALTFPAGLGSGTAWTVISEVQSGKSRTDAEARSRLARVTSDLDGDFKIIIDESPFIIENKLYVRDFEKPWNSAYDGLIYVGDAAHPVRPTGQGMALALEDAVILGDLVAKHGLGVGAFRMYEQQRYQPIKDISNKIRKAAEESYERNHV
ncbi:unnamed protein product, partial [Heterosigma akashiwo]